MGSVEAAVQQLRRRNIAIGIVVLVILGAGLIATWIASERVRKLGQMQIELAAGISHELRTPLAVIRSAGYNMAAGHVSSRDDIVRYGNLFQDQGRRLSEVVEQALLFAQTHSGRNSYSLQPADAAELVTKVVQSCNGLNGTASKQIVLKLPPDVPLVMTDITALSHCLHNLIVNALKYAGPEGQIVVEVRSSPEKPAAEVEIVVSDDGPGIDRRDLPHLFEPFYRGRNSANIEGNGLGLYLVRRTIQSIRGRVSVTSSAGNGARFVLHVPAIQEVTAKA
jgi:signal transduction histidine kinase